MFLGKWLNNNKTPGRKVKQIDNRGSNFYIALYWAEELAAKDSAWAPLAQALKDNEEQIVQVSRLKLMSSTTKYSIIGYFA